MLADVAEKIEKSDRRGPVRIVHELRGIRRRIKIEKARELGSDRFDIGLEEIFREQIALGGFATWVTDAAGRAAGQGDGDMTGVLKTSQRQQRHEMPDVEGIRRGIEACVKCDRSLGHAFEQGRLVSAVGHEATP